MSGGAGRGSLKCEDDRSLLSQRLWSDILMCLCLNHTPTHTVSQRLLTFQPRDFSDIWRLVTMHSGLLLISVLTYIILLHCQLASPMYISNFESIVRGVYGRSLTAVLMVFVLCIHIVRTDFQCHLQTSVMFSLSIWYTTIKLCSK